MYRYVINRLLWMIVIVLLAAVVVFTLMYMIPGDPAKLMLGLEASEEVLAQKAHQLGTDQPYIVQLGNYLWSVITLDFGNSWKYSVPVMDQLAARLQHTIIIGGVGMLLNVLIGTVLGIFAATHEGRWQDSMTMVIAMVFISAPGFWVALMAIILFSSWLGILPATFVLGDWRSYVLPTVCGALGGIAINARQSRSAMLEVIRADFVTTARAKGQKEKLVVRRHMLPNALMPIITGVGGGLAMIVAGSAVMENVFSVPGVGQYLLDGVNQRDRPVVCGCVVFFAGFTSIAILLTDLAYAFLDPRIKAQYTRRKKAN